MEPVLNRYQKAKVRITEKRSEWKQVFHGAGNLVAFMARFFKEVFGL